jgi:CO/xanthine dehydrogenase FAD-binding subunit
MRSYLPSFALRRTQTLDEALRFLAEQPGRWRPFAGGTDLMVLLAAGMLQHQEFVGIWGIEELRRIVVTDEAISLGALSTFSDVLRHPILHQEFPLLCRAAADTGGIANQNRGTIGGNIANASPAADTPPALLAYDAELDIASTRGRRRVPYGQFHKAYKQMDLGPDELIAGIWLPRRQGWAQHYRKVGARRAQAISKVCFAGSAKVQEGHIADVRLAFGSVAPTVIRATAAETIVRGTELNRRTIESAAESLQLQLAPIDDIRSTARYRSRVAVNLLREFLESLQRSDTPAADTYS